MKRKFGFEFRVTSITLLLLGMTAIVGVYTYNSYSNIIKKLQSNTFEDVELVCAKATMDNIYKAGINVKSYTITKDTLYLNKYRKFREQVFVQLSRLDSLDFEEDHLPIIDSIISLSFLKVDQMDALMNIHVSLRVSNAFDTAYEKMKDEASHQKVDEEKKWKLFQKLKIKKKKNDAEEGVSLEEIKKNLAEIKEKETEVNKELIQQELDLINYGNELAEKIGAQIAKLEMLKSEELGKTSSLIKRNIKGLNSQIIIFCSVLIAFLLLLIFNILSYSRSNNKFKAALRSAKKEAERLAKARGQFLATVSHEIRTPMNAISGFTDQIAKGPLTEEQREQIEMVQKSTSSLLHLVNDVLDISKLRKGKVVLEKVDFYVGDVFEDIASFVRPMAEEKNIDFSCHVKSNVPLVLNGDTHRLQQILLNLISNAIKFTKDGEIKVEVFPTLMEGENVILKIVVSDTGIGMTKEQLKRVFVEFEQAEASVTRNYGGTGLGLPITNKLVHLFGGSIDIDSNVDDGTQVTVELPFRLGDKDKVITVRNEKTPDTSFLRGKRILVADDEPFNRKLLQSMLKDTGVEIVEASNGKEALQLVKSETFDVVLMDVRMPELNGMDATRRIRKINDNSKKDVIIIALTAAVTDDDKRNFLHSGMDGFVPKPFRESQLLKALHVAFEGVEKLKMQELPVKEEHQLEVIEEMETEVDFKELEKLSDNDHSFYIDMLKTFVEGAEDAIEKINTCFQEKELHQIPNHAHKISAPTRHLGANKLYKILKTIEVEGRNKNYDNYEQLIALCEIEMKAVIKIVEDHMKG